ncbi:MAG: methyltransferase, FkbM family [Bryobacterales bacterium]|jgi:FkbM family methyltransferase|nr:methyltransferase, FkbM family [Bryobacterales bacterium]
MTLPLIIDVGAHVGDDTAYYAFCGYRVVAVEANPVLAAELRTKFSDQHVIVENVCIGPSDSQKVPFWVNQVKSAWSAFDRELASREGNPAVMVEVPSITMRTLLKRHGVPHYLKIDIEGMDQECLRSMDPANLPKYISLELSHGDNIMGSLAALGYTRFKVLNQGTFTSATPIFEHEIGWRFLRKSKLGRLLPNGLKVDFDTFHVSGWTFPEGCSGPFAEQTFGEWLSLDRAKRLHERIQQGYTRGGVPLSHCWYDVHATR